MAVKVAGVAIPAGATVDIRIEMTAQANITAFVARQKVTQFVVTRIGSQLRGEASRTFTSMSGSAGRCRWS